MYKLSELKQMTIQQLTPLAKKHGIKRLHSLCKDDLIEMLFHRMLKEELGTQKKVDPFVELVSRTGKKKKAAEATKKPEKKVEKPASPVKLKELGKKKEPVAKAGKSAKSTANKTHDEVGSGEVASRSNPVKFPFAAGNVGEKSTVGKNVRLGELHARLSQVHDLAYLPDAVSGDIREESLQVDVIDPYWLHVTWCLRRLTIERARIALGHEWFDAKPVLSVTVLSENEAGSLRHHHLQYIDIHGGVNHWFINVENPPGTYQVEIGYLASTRFFALLKGNIVKTPCIGTALRYERPREEDPILGELAPASTPDWSPNDRNMYMHWQQRSSQKSPGNGTGFYTGGISPNGNGKRNGRRIVEEHPFEIETEMIIYGMTSPDSQVTVDQEWVAVQPDGTFMLRFDLPEQGRQMLAIDSTNREESRKIILTLERTTKVMEPKLLDEGLIEF